MSTMNGDPPRPPLWMSILGRMSIVLLLAAGALFFSNRLAMDSLVETLLEQRVQQIEQNLVAATAQALMQKSGPSLTAIAHNFGTTNPSLIEITFKGEQALPLASWQAADRNALKGTEFRTHPVLVLGNKVGTVSFRLHTGLITEHIREQLAPFEWALFYGTLAAILLISLAGTWISSRRILSPLAHLIHQTDSVILTSSKPSTEDKPKGWSSEFLRLDQVCEHYRHIEKETASTRIAVQTNSEVQTKFLRHLDKQIRTPLSSIMGVVELLQEREQDSQTKSHLALIKAASDSLITVVNDVLEFSMIEGEHVQIKTEVFSLERLVSGPMEALAPIAEENGLAFSCSIDTDVPAYLKGDKTRLQQILNNLINNALAFTEKGAVNLRVRKLQDGSSKNRPTIQFIVQDTSPGLPPAQGLVGRAHFRDESSTLPTGLGLSLTRSLLKKMDGTLTCESMPEKGNSVRVSVPMEISTNAPHSELEVEEMTTSTSAATYTEQSSESSPSLNLLLAEDNRLNRTMLTAILEAAGHQVVVAENGADALKEYSQQDFDLILMDVSMPVMNGFEATKQIRLQEQFSSRRTPILALTAHALESDRQHCLKAGMDDYYRKPVRKKQLLNLIANLTQQRNQSEAIQKGRMPTRDETH